MEPSTKTGMDEPPASRSGPKRHARIPGRQGSGSLGSRWRDPGGDPCPGSGVMDNAGRLESPGIGESRSNERETHHRASGRALARDVQSGGHRWARPSSANEPPPALSHSSFFNPSRNGPGITSDKRGAPVMDRSGDPATGLTEGLLGRAWAIGRPSVPPAAGSGDHCGEHLRSRQPTWKPGVWGDFAAEPPGGIALQARPQPPQVGWPGPRGGWGQAGFAAQPPEEPVTKRFTAVVGRPVPNHSESHSWLILRYRCDSLIGRGVAVW